MSYESTGILQVGHGSGAEMHSPTEGPVVQGAPYQDHATHWHGTPTDMVRVNPFGGQESFAWKLHQLLEDAEENGFDHVIGWRPHGRAFKVHNRRDFLDRVASRYFSQTRFSSFQRQLNMYGFVRIRRRDVDDFGCYYHEMFLRGRPTLCSYMQRRPKTAACPAYMPLSMEPDLYSMPYVYKKNVSPQDEPSANPLVPSIEEAAAGSSAKQTSQEPNVSQIVAYFPEEPHRRPSGPCSNENRSICSLEETSSLLGRKRILDATDTPATPRDGKLQRLPTITTHFAEISNHPAATIKSSSIALDAPSEQNHFSCSSPGKWPLRDDDDPLQLDSVQSVPAAADILEAINYSIDFGK